MSIDNKNSDSKNSDGKELTEHNELGTEHINAGDKEMSPKASVEEKGQKTAVAYNDMFGNPVEVPTYFTVEEGDGSQKALHHVKDAEEISDVIRQARVNEEGERTWD